MNDDEDKDDYVNSAAAKRASQKLKRGAVQADDDEFADENFENGPTLPPRTHYQQKKEPTKQQVPPTPPNSLASEYMNPSSQLQATRDGSSLGFSSAVEPQPVATKSTAVPNIFMAELSSQLARRGSNTPLVDTKANKQNNSSSRAEMPEKKQAPRRHNENSLPSDYYLPNATRESCADILNEIREDGAFIVRNKAGIPQQPYSMSIYHNNEVYNLEIRRLDSTKYALGKPKECEIFFESVPHMIDHYTKNYLQVAQKGAVKLKISEIKQYFDDARC